MREHEHNATVEATFCWFKLTALMFTSRNRQHNLMANSKKKNSIIWGYFNSCSCFCKGVVEEWTATSCSWSRVIFRLPPTSKRTRGQTRSFWRFRGTETISIPIELHDRAARNHHQAQWRSKRRRCCSSVSHCYVPIEVLESLKASCYLKKHERV